jgi:hypothetical protein
VEYFQPHSQMNEGAPTVARLLELHVFAMPILEQALDDGGELRVLGQRFGEEPLPLLQHDVGVHVGRIDRLPRLFDGAC